MRIDFTPGGPLILVLHVVTIDVEPFVSCLIGLFLAEVLLLPTTAGILGASGKFSYSLGGVI